MATLEWFSATPFFRDTQYFPQASFHKLVLRRPHEQQPTALEGMDSRVPEHSTKTLPPKGAAWRDEISITA
jgi:hypothetical protein